jgi:prepilin-type N-terminal cleavage/methylation domain-containing protein/prepilin-type processing-associated H-X9-DG protein
MKAIPNPNANSKGSGAFTLVELLVVVVIIALGVAMLAPALARTRTNRPALQCLYNERQIAMAWIMYAGDNGGSLAPNSDGVNAGESSTSPSWVVGWLDFTANHTDNTNTTMLVRHDMWPYGAFLGPYVGKSAAVFKCPGDHSTALEGGAAMPRARSISMNNFVGNPSRTFNGSSKYPTYRTLPQVMSPASMFVTLDEQELSINDGCFFTAPEILYQLVDYPASYHGNAAGFSFADGHSEIHKWLDPHTCPPPSGYLILNVNLPGDKDVLWLSQHAVGAATYP